MNKPRFPLPNQLPMTATTPGQPVVCIMPPKTCCTISGSSTLNHTVFSKLSKLLLSIINYPKNKEIGLRKCLLEKYYGFNIADCILYQNCQITNLKVSIIYMGYPESASSKAIYILSVKVLMLKWNSKIALFHAYPTHNYFPDSHFNTLPRKRKTPPFIQSDRTKQTSSASILTQSLSDICYFCAN